MKRLYKIPSSLSNLVSCFLVTGPLIHTKHDLTLIDIDYVLFVLYMGKHMDKHMDRK